MEKKFLWDGVRVLAKMAADYQENLVIIVRKDGSYQVINIDPNENAVPGEGAPDTANHI